MYADVYTSHADIISSQTGYWSNIYYLIAFMFSLMGGLAMGMVKKSISVTEQQNDWIKAQIKTGHFGNESEIIRELIRERQLREQESTAEIEAIRTALIEGEQSGFSDFSIDEIWESARLRHRSRSG